MTEPQIAERFYWEGRLVGTVGDLFDEASRAEREGKAVEFLIAYRAANPHADRNLGYVIGYGSPEDRARLYAAFDLTHPTLGGRP